jgi:hypothetical protein
MDIREPYPPALIFLEFKCSLERLSAASCHPSGWMQAQLFTNSMLKSETTKEEWIILPPVGYKSDTRNIRLRKRIVCLCPHSRHKSLFGRLQINCKNRYDNSSGVKDELLGIPTRWSFSEELTLRHRQGQTLVKGFRATKGQVFRDGEFAATATQAAIWAQG